MSHFQLYLVQYLESTQNYYCCFQMPSTTHCNKHPLQQLLAKVVCHGKMNLFGIFKRFLINKKVEVALGIIMELGITKQLL